MSVRKEEVQQEVNQLTAEGQHTALSFLIGYNVLAVATAIKYVRDFFPEGIATPESNAWGAPEGTVWGAMPPPRLDEEGDR